MAYDFGIKTSILRMLSELATVEVVPASTPAASVMLRRPDGVFLSNGPGDPAAVTYAVDAIRDLLWADVPVFGICLGHQLMASALGGSTFKLPFGHHGGNHPVKRLRDGAVEITSQNHSYAVAEGSVARRRRHPRQPQRRGHRGPRLPRRAGVQRPVPPRGGPGPPRRPLPVRGLPPADDGRAPVNSPRTDPLDACNPPRDQSRALMPKRTDIQSILLIGSGPIVIGQACEFDYSGTQACRVLKEEGYRVILVNSNPATIMTDPDFAHRTYVEPLDWETVAAVVERERPDAILPTLGGQTGLNLAMALHERGVLAEFGVELIGASAEAIRTAENREPFKAAMTEIGLAVPPSGFAYATHEAAKVGDEIGYPVIVRPSYILGGRGTGIADNAEELTALAEIGLAASPISEILIERSIAGWKEYELEVMRDRADNCVVVCSIENFDPMGVHTGDSITVAPAQTLSDVEYQRMRDAAFACIRRIGVDTGGSNIQFAVNPANGDMVVIEMNPRVSRSSAPGLARPPGSPSPRSRPSWPSATRSTRSPTTSPARPRPASSPPSTTWSPRSPGGRSRSSPASPTCSAPACSRWGRPWPSAGRSPSRCRRGCGRWSTAGGASTATRPRSPSTTSTTTSWWPGRRWPRPTARSSWRRPCAGGSAWSGCTRPPGSTRGSSTRSSASSTSGPSWPPSASTGMTRADWRRAKRLGFSDPQLGYIWGGVAEDEVRAARLAVGVRATFKTVDTCGAEFEAATPYHYSTYEDEDEARPGSGPRS